VCVRERTDIKHCDVAAWTAAQRAGGVRRLVRAPTRCDAIDVLGTIPPSCVSVCEREDGHQTLRRRGVDGGTACGRGAAPGASPYTMRCD
jgi:hypothetical protein